MKKSVFFILHALVIAVYITLIFLSSFALAQYYKLSYFFTFVDSILSMGSFLALFYYSYWLFLPNFLINRKYLKFGLGLLSVIVGFTLFFNCSAIIAASVFKVRFHVFVKGNWIGIAGYSAFIGLAGTAFRLFFQWFKDATDKAELEKQNYKSELSLLKNQLNPHFLFNTLNNIDSLILDHPKNASLALNKLSEIMRYMVYDSEKELVPLQDEIDYIQNYISLQKLRISNQEIIQYHESGEVSDLKIAPMLFIPFIENAFKHSSLKDAPDNKIEIKIEVKGNSLSFSCINKIADIQKDKSSGVGMELVRKRLDLIYKDRYQLAIDRSVNVFCVKLDLSL